MKHKIRANLSICVMYLTAFGICVLKYMSLILLILFLHQELTWQAALKKAKVKEDLLTDIDLLLTVENILEVELSCYSLICKS